MLIRKIDISNESFEIIKALKHKTGLGSAVLCRFALMLSLNDESAPTEDYLCEETEFSLVEMGDKWMKIITALLKQRSTKNKVESERSFKEALIIHLNRGLKKLDSQINSLNSIEFILNSAINY